MNPELDPRGIGRQLGEDGVASIVAKVEQYCAHEEQRIALDNHAVITMLKADLSLLVEEESRVREQLRQAPPPTDLRHHRRKKTLAWAAAVILTVTGFFLAVLTFAPFRLGWQEYLFCAGIAVVVPFLTERLLQEERLELVIKTLTAIGFVAGLASLMLLADVRGHLLEHEVQSAPAVVIDDAQPEQQASPDDFYVKTLGSLRLATVLLALAMELSAGIALRDAMAKAPHDPGEWTRLREELANIRGRMVALVGEITRREDAPASFHARFWRDFYRSMLTHTVRSAMTKILILMLAASLIPRAQAATAQPLNLVIALDLSRSVDVKGPDGKTEFQKNVDGVTGVLAQVPSGTHVTVIGITDRSFAQPYILLSATMPEDAGYFGERLTGARRQLMGTWKQRSAKLAPTFNGTDILGALELAGQIFHQRPTTGERRVVVILSDMRNRTPELNLESRTGLAVALEQQAKRRARIGDLRNVHVLALGVESAENAPANWEQLNEFWKVNLGRSGASLETFSVLRTADLMTIR